MILNFFQEKCYYYIQIQQTAMQTIKNTYNQQNAQAIDTAWTNDCVKCSMVACYDTEI